MSRGPNVFEWYFNWLYNEQVAAGAIKGTFPKYQKLCRYLHKKIFYWSVDYDYNRQADGYDLRTKFLEEHEVSRYNEEKLLDEPVSVFEVLVGLINRMEYSLYDPDLSPRNSVWFQEIIGNLGISDLVDDAFTWVAQKDVDLVIQVLLDRTYEENGDGSFFPLKYAKEDMTRVEIWYQLMAYINENYTAI